MKRIHFTMLVCTAALLATTPAQARTFAQIKESGVLYVATPGDLPPFNIDSGSKMTGFEVELIEKLAADLGLSVRYEKVRIDQLSRHLQDDRADVGLAALGITSTRENKVDFTSPTGCAGVSMVSLNAAIKKHTDLVGKAIGVPAGSIMLSYVQKLPFEKKITAYPSTNAVILGLLKREVDATFAYSVMGPVMKRMYPKAGVIFSPELWSVPQGFMVQEDGDQTRLALNSSLNKLMQNGTYAQISKKYFGKDLRCKA